MFAGFPALPMHRVHDSFLKGHFEPERLYTVTWKCLNVLMSDGTRAGLR